MQIEDSSERCNEMPGHSGCARHNERTHLHKPNGCPGNGACVSRYPNHPQALPDIAKIFREQPYTPIRFLVHRKKLRAARATCP